MQAAIYRDGLIPVHRETLVETDDGRRLTIQAAESLTGSVGFRDPQRNFWFMSGPLQGRPDKPFVKPTCIDVGW